MIGENKQELKSTRDGFGQGLLELGKNNKQVVGLCADLTGSLRMSEFEKKYPKRFFQVGVAEQNLVGVASGLALEGFIPFAASFAVFNPGRNWDQIRVSVCYNNVNVKVVGGHAGLTVGADGATHQALEDIALMRTLPNMTVIVPADFHEAKRATIACASHDGPVYLRIGRESFPFITKENSVFKIGKVNVLKKGIDVTIFACGIMVEKALQAARILAYENVSVEVINNHTIKPLDKRRILASVAKTKCVVTAEEHQIAGGMGSAIAELLAQKHPVPIEMVGVKDTFGETGTPQELLKKYKLTHKDIVKAVRKVLLRK